MPIGGRVVQVASLRHLPGKHKYIAMVPQWDLLDLLARAGRDEPSFTLRMSTAVTGLVHEDGRVAGVTYRTDTGDGELRADLVVGCDGRDSVVRDAAGLEVIDWTCPRCASTFEMSAVCPCAGAAIATMATGARARARFVGKVMLKLLGIFVAGLAFPH